MEEVCGKSIPQNGGGGKRHSASEVCSSTVLSVSGLTFLDSPPGGAGGLTPPQPTQGSFEKGKREEVFGFPLKRWKGRFSLQTPFSVNFLTTTFSTLLSNWGAVLVFAKDRRPFLKAYGFRLIFSFTAITPEHQSAGGKAEVNR